MSDNSSTKHCFDFRDSTVPSIDGIVPDQEASTCSKENLYVVSAASTEKLSRSPYREHDVENIANCVCSSCGLCTKCVAPWCPVKAFRVIYTSISTAANAFGRQILTYHPSPSSRSSCSNRTFHPHYRSCNIHLSDHPANP